MSNTYKNNIIKTIDDIQDKLIDISALIFANPELGNQEYFAQKTLGKALEDEGFNIRYGTTSHETDFVATKKSEKDGPKIVFLAEYDALPDIGHGCGHNLIGTASTGAAIAIGRIINELGGEVVVLGTPAEEGGNNGSAKATFVNKGFFYDVDAALMFHPASRNGITKRTQSVEPVDIEFFGQTSHAAGSPEKGINALQALITFFTTLNTFKLSKFKDLNIHGVILDGGKVPNVIPDYTKARFYVRALTSDESLEAIETINDILKGINTIYGTTSQLTYFQNRVDHFIFNDKFDNVFSDLYEELTGKEFDKNRGDGKGSTDASNVSHVVPTIHPNLSIGDDCLASHTVEFANATISDKGKNALVLASKLLALTALKLYEDKELLDNIKLQK